MMEQTIPVPVEAAQVETLPAESGGMVQMIERLALSPDVDVTKLEKLLELQERIMDREAEQAFNAAMRDTQEEMPDVVRDSENSQTRSKYARLETISRAIDPVITSHGFSTSFGTADSPLDSHYRVVCTVSHVGGHSREYHADVPTDMTGLKGNANKTATHGFGSTMSYGRRYLKLLIFDVSLVDEDDDGNNAGAGDKISQEQLDELLALADEVGADKERFCKWANVPSFADIPAANFEKAKEVLEAKRAQK